MFKTIQQSQIMEPETIKKNGVSPKNLIRSRGNFLFLLVTVLVANNLQAQFKFGVLAGINATCLDNYIEPESFKLGYQAGILVDYVLYAGVGAIQSGILFTQQGCRSSKEVFGISLKPEETAKINLNYIRVPVNIQFFPSKKLILMSGFYFDYAVSGTVKAVTNSVSVEEKIKFGKDNVRAFDFGGNTGIGWNFGNIKCCLYTSQGFINTNIIPDKNYHNVSCSLVLTCFFGK